MWKTLSIYVLVTIKNVGYCTRLWALLSSMALVSIYQKIMCLLRWTNNQSYKIVVLQEWNTSIGVNLHHSNSRKLKTANLNVRMISIVSKNLRKGISLIYLFIDTRRGWPWTAIFDIFAPTATTITRLLSVTHSFIKRVTKRWRFKFGRVNRPWIKFSTMNTFFMFPSWFVRFL